MKYSTIDYEKQQEWEDKLYNTKHVPFSSEALTNIALGHVRGHVTLLTAGSGVGKTRFTVSEMWKEIEAGNKVLYVSDETTLNMLTKIIKESQYDNEAFKENLIHMEWFDFYEALTAWYNEPIKENCEMLKLGIKSIFIDYLAGDLLASAMNQNNGEAYNIAMIMKEFFREVRKISELHEIYFQINAQQIPTPIGTDIYDGTYIQSCKTLHESVDLYISLCKQEERGKTRLSIIKNRFGMNLIHIDMSTDYNKSSFKDISSAKFYDGSEVYHDFI